MSALPLPAAFASRSDHAPDETTPGGYLKACRRRSGLTLRQALARVTPMPDDQDRLSRELARLERGVPGDYKELVGRLHRRRAFRFDLAHFYALAAATCDPDLDPWGLL